MGLRSSHAKRKGTGRKARKRRIVRLRVHKHTHRRYAGIRHRGGGSARKPRVGKARVGKARVSKTGRKRAYHGRKKSTTPRAKPGQGKKYVRKGRHGPRKKGVHHIYKGRRKSLHKRVVKKGLHRRFLGRKKSTHKRVVKPGLHRRYFGRKPRASSALRKKQAAVNTITSANYINMF